MSQHNAHTQHGVVELPAPTKWPIVLALGVTLALTGLVTHWAITLLGVLMILPAAAGWFLQVLPHEHHAPVPVSTHELTVDHAYAAIGARQPASGARHEVHPVATYNTFTAGISGGLVGAVAMTIPATVYGLIRYYSVWYSINLLAAGGFTSWENASNEFLAQFHMQGLLAGTVIHGTTSLLVGLLYAAMLPMFPRKPILTAGFIAPLVWSGLLHASLGIISPILDQRIDWPWFVASQIFFGLVAGYVVNLQVKVRSKEFRALPFAVRAGLHTDARFDQPEDSTHTGFVNSGLGSDNKNNETDKKDGPA
jgi:hypothetical protein